MACIGYRCPDCGHYESDNHPPIRGRECRVCGAKLQVEFDEPRTERERKRWEVED